VLSEGCRSSYDIFTERDNMPLLIFQGDSKVRQYRGDGLFCKAGFPATCKVDVPLSHAIRLLSEHKDWWDVAAESKKEIEEADKRLLALKTNGNIKLKFRGNLTQRQYRGDGIYCHADSSKLNTVSVSIKKARQLLMDMPSMWIDIDKVIRKEELKEETVFNQKVEAVKAPLKKIAKERDIDISTASKSDDLIHALQLDDEKAAAKVVQKAGK
jgi:hypothetical protein